MKSAVEQLKSAAEGREQERAKLVEQVANASQASSQHAVKEQALQKALSVKQIHVEQCFTDGTWG